MLLPDGTTLKHGKQPYDPRKAHQYYLRTRELKGRRSGSKMTVGGGVRKPESFNVQLDGNKVVLSAQELAKQKAYAEVRVKSIKLKLEKLKFILREKLKKAEEADRARKEAEKPDTAAEKAKKARDAKKFRDKHKQELKTKAKQRDDKTDHKPETNKESEVDKLKSSIEAAKINLKSAIDHQKALASATKN